jgi:Domain of unknown function (DUF6268)
VTLVYLRRVFFSLFAVSLGLIFFVSSSPAQTNEDIEEKALEAAKTDVVHTAESYVRYMPSRHEYGAQGKISIMESAAEYGYEFKAFGKLPVKFSVGNSYIGINDTQDTIELPAHLVGVTTDIETTMPVFNFNNTYLGLGISPSFFGDDWTFNTDAFRIPSRYFLIYQPDKKWTFLAGVAYYSDFTYTVLPIVGFIYKPNDKLIFDLTPRRPNITYSFNDKIAVFIDGLTAFDEFAVSRDNIKNIALQYRQTQVGSGIKFKLNRYLQAYLSAGGAFNRYFEYTDSQGKVNLKNGLYTQFRVEISS